MVGIREKQRGQRATEDVLVNTQAEEAEEQVAASEGPPEERLVS